MDTSQDAGPSQLALMKIVIVRADNSDLFPIRIGTIQRSLSARYKEVLRKDPCAYCGEPSDTVDHIQAVTKDGKNGWPNLSGACAVCNNQKANFPLLKFLIKKHRYDLRVQTQEVGFGKSLGRELVGKVRHTIAENWFY